MLRVGCRLEHSVWRGKVEVTLRTSFGTRVLRLEGVVGNSPIILFDSCVDNIINKFTIPVPLLYETVSLLYRHSCTDHS